ncbi:TolC family protein [Geomonas agri]|uniref:TolC family protein n=1 Tax=Geomonas agri TaxID=2873702 RepID=UPI001CD4A08A|nr:TolC family protein [Geomonas agri]
MKKTPVNALIMFSFLLSTGCAVHTTPLTTSELMSRVAADRSAMFQGQEAVQAPITLEEAMARSLKYNLDHRIKIMEDALALRQADVMSYDMLPRLVASAGYSQRDSYNASSSINYSTHEQSLVPSYSSPRDHFTSDLTLSWNILDFGVSYLQAKQQSDRIHIMNERRRKVVHTIIQQVRQAYWQALGAQQMEGRFEPLLAQVRKALNDIECVEGEKLRPPLETLNYRKTLLEILKQLETFRDELQQAKPRLAALMNLPPGQSFTLVVPPGMEVPGLCDTLAAMEEKALLQRPELIEADYNERISADDVRKSILRMLPGLELNVGGYYDSNGLLVNNSWVDGGARLTWNLMTLLGGPSQYKLAKGQAELIKAQRMALSMAILTQVHIAYQNYQTQVHQFELAGELRDVEKKIYEQTRNATASGSQSKINEIRSATSTLMAEYRNYQNYAAVQNAYGQVNASLGQDPLPQAVASHELPQLTQSIRTQLETKCPAPERFYQRAVCQPATPATPAIPTGSPLPQGLR